MGNWQITGNDGETSNSFGEAIGPGHPGYKKLLKEIAKNYTPEVLNRLRYENRNKEKMNDNK